ncbi:unnamed protein product [Sympodiomycopsis kandeliae]
MAAAGVQFENPRPRRWRNPSQSSFCSVFEDSTDPLSSSSTSDMPPFPETSAKPVGSLWNAYVAAIARLRQGSKPDGFSYLGSATRTEAEKFANARDRRYPIMILPTTTTNVDVWLVGDPTFVHSRLAHGLGQQFFRATFNERYDFATRLAIATAMDSAVSNNGDAANRIYVRSSGIIGKKAFSVGFANKEADGLLTQAIGASHTRTLAIEVAYLHETPANLLFEASLWSQQGRGLITPVVSPVNFLGVHVEEGRTFMDDWTLGACWCVLVMRAADEEGNGDRQVYLLNATWAYEQKWRAAIAESPVFRGMAVSRTTQVDIPYALGHNSLPDLLADATFTLSSQQLSTMYIAARQLEQSNAEQQV